MQEGHARSAAPGLVVALTLALAVAAALESCKSEDVHTATVIIDGVDGGALNGFDCVAVESDARVVNCIVSGCFERCKGDRTTPVPDCIKACSQDPNGEVVNGCKPSAAAPPLLFRASGKPVCCLLYTSPSP